MNNISRALVRLKASLVLVSSNKSLLLYPVFGMCINLGLLAGIVVAFIRYFPTTVSDRNEVLLIVLACLCLAIFNLISIFASATFFTAVNLALEGNRPSLRVVWKKVYARRRSLFAWWLFATGVFFVIALVRMGIEKILGIFGKGADSIIGIIATEALGIGWSFATYFAVQLIMTHGTNPIDTLKQSAGLIRRSWGERLVGNGGIGLFGLAAFMLSGMLIVTPINYLIYRLSGTETSVMYAIVAALVFGIVISTTIILSATMSAIFDASLFRYAETGDYVGPFSQDVIRGAFRK
jgi:Family of unknown function (DUF6159)